MSDPMETEETQQWDEVMHLAEKYGLIAQAYGGTAILICHNVQREQGIYDRVQYANGRGQQKLFPTSGE